MPAAPELTVVVPAWNEAAGIVSVVAEWTGALDRLGVDFELRLYDDGSTDGTGERLGELAAADPRLRATSHANRGHGPTVLRGYREAAGTWIAQVDGDGEIPASAFPALWEARDGVDLVLGARRGRAQGAGRRLLSLGARVAVRLAAGAAPADVNTPFRLMRAEAFRPLFAALPDDAAVPNVLLVALALRHRLAWRELPVAWQGRRTGATSLTARRVVSLGWRAGREVLRLAATRHGAR